MKVALLYPGIVLDGFAKNNVKPKTGWIQHGLCYISSVLKKEGHDVSLIDLRQLNGWEELSHIVKDIMPDIVGITMLSLEFNVALKSAEIIKKVNNSIKVIVGGPHPTLAESELIDNPSIDYIFKGEAEVTLPKILENMVNGDVKEKVITGEIPDLDKIPFPDRSLFRVLEVPIVPFLKMPFVTAIAGRGCRYNCSFCQPAERLIHSSKIRRVSVEKFIEELEIARNTIGLNTLMIHDDCMADNTNWVERFLRQYRKKGFRKSFICQSRADIIVKKSKLFKDMRKHGLQMIMIGFESGSQRVLNFLRKGTTVEQNYKAARICKKLGIRIWANFMLGIPTETTEEAMATVKMIKRIKPYVSSPTFYVPNPGSDLYKFCMQNNLSLVERYEDHKRNPEIPKIRGLDYVFLRKCLGETMRMPYPVKLKRKIDKLKLRHFNKELIKNYEP